MSPLFRFFVGILFIGGMLNRPASAQTYYPSSVPDQAASNAKSYHTFKRHTGTDALVVNEQVYQLSTWDDVDATGKGSVYLSLSIGNSIVVPSQVVLPAVNNASLSDPDVVMANLSDNNKDDKLWVNLVYIATYPDLSGSGQLINQTYIDYYVFDHGKMEFIQQFTPIKLGLTLTSNPMVNRRHSSPNIDANERGFVAVTWQETSVEKGYVTSTFPSFTQTSAVNTVFANVYLVKGTVDVPIVDVCPGKRGGRVTVVSNTKTPDVLFNTNTNPDVAISNYNGDYVSVSFVNSFATAVEVPEHGKPTDDDYEPATTTVRTTSQLVVNQYVNLCPVDPPSGTMPETWSPGLSLPSSISVSRILQPVAHMEWQDGVSQGGQGTPRIAAANNPNTEFLRDVEVAMDWEGSDCPVRIGPVVYREIHNWGCVRGQFRPSYSVVSPPLVPNETTTPTTLPVVAYYDAPRDSNPYIITWMAKNYPQGQGFDIWGRTLISGEPVGSSLGYTRINGKGEESIDGDQWSPSVAARNLKDPNSSVHLFNDDVRRQISFKSLLQQPGNGPAQRSSSLAAPAEPNAGRLGTMEAFPNPFSGAVEFNLGLRPQESAQQLVLTDMLGRVVEKVKIPSAQAYNQHFIWSVKQPLPEGIYQVFFVTNQRTETLRLNKR